MIKLAVRNRFDFPAATGRTEPVAVEWFDRERFAFEPPSKMVVSKWASERRMLQAGVSRQPGPWSNEMTPYLCGPMDAYNELGVRHLVLCFGTQLGKTESLYNILGYIVDQDPYSTLLVYPREDDSKTVSRTRIQPMIEDCPSLRAKKPSQQDRYQLLEMHFPGMILYMVGANSPAALAQKPCRNILRDEIDKYPDKVGKDADPLSLSEERAKSFWDIRKIVDVSSPTLESVGIWKQLQSCDVIRVFMVPCPHCGEYQKLKFAQIKWDKPAGDESKIQVAKLTARYECEACEAPISDDHKLWMLQNGRWEDEKESDTPPSKVGFHLSSLYSPWLTWADMAEKHLNALAEKEEKASNEPLQNFINGWLAEPWVNRIQAAKDDDILLARVDLAPQTVPAEAVALTAFVDVQRYGFWFSVRAWARDYTSWLIHYGNLTTWEDVEHLLFENRYPCEVRDESMPIWRAGLDTGGTKGTGDLTMTEEAYFWLRRNGIGRGCRVWGTKGSSTPLPGKLQLGKPLDKTPSGKPLPGGLQIVMLDTGKLKDAFHYRLDLARRRELGAAYLHSDTDHVYVSHITAEEKRIDGKGHEEWVKIRARNDLLDCEVGNLVLADPEWPGGGINLLHGEQTGTKRPRPPAGSQSGHVPIMRQRTINPWAGRAHA